MSLLKRLGMQFNQRNETDFRAWLKPSDRFQFVGLSVFTLAGLTVCGLTWTGVFHSGFESYNGAVLALALAGEWVNWTKLGLLYEVFQLEKKLIDSQATIDILTKDARAIVGNIAEGLYIFKSNEADELLIDDLHSPLFHEELDGRTESANESLEAIFQASALGPDALQAMRTILTKSLGDTILHWDFNAPSLPKELRLSLDRGSRVVTAQWEAVRGDDGIVQKILLLLQDVTELRLMYEDSRARSDDAKRLMELISNSPKKIGEFFAIAEAVITEGKGTVEGETAALNLKNIHTLKGMARGYQLTELSECFTQLEDSVQSLPISTAKSLLHLPAFLACEISLRNYKNLFMRAYTRHISGNQVSADPKVVLDLAHQIEMAYVRSDIEGAFNALNEIRAIFACTLDKIVIDEISMVRKLADELNKPQPNIYVNELDIQLNETGKITLRKVFVHLFRNSIDHGIEPEDERLSKGKVGRGQISIHTAKGREYYRITYKDDGQGLSLPKILKKAIDLGMTDADRKYTAQEMAELIFQSGLSTTVTPNPISGRGVGMDAIRSFLRQEGGNISIELDPESEGPMQKFAFLIDIPLSKGDQKPELSKRAS